MERKMARISVSFKKLTNEAVLPEYATRGAAGMDLRVINGGTIDPHKTSLFKTGLSVEIPSDWELQIRSRSGMSLKGVVVANSPGTIDSDYRGEIGILLHNNSDHPITIEPGQRVAQAVLAYAPQADLYEKGELSSTERGAGGFGSTGTK